MVYPGTGIIEVLDKQILHDRSIAIYTFLGGVAAAFILFVNYKCPVAYPSIETKGCVA